MIKKILIPFYAAALLFTAGCTKVDVFEKNTYFKNQSWAAAEKPVVQFTITDTASLYNLYLVLRHTDAYNFNNLWMNVYTLSPGETKPLKQQLDLTLATNSKGWLGAGMDDIFEHRIRITRDAIPFKKAGTYKFSFEQIMREDPLQHILNVGLRIERAP